jgi:hypothetical protein
MPLKQEATTPTSVPHSECPVMHTSVSIAQAQSIHRIVMLTARRKPRHRLKFMMRSFIRWIGPCP